MSYLKLETAEKKQIPTIKRLYRRAFPRNERKLFFIIMRNQKQGNMEILSLNNGSLVGLCITVLYSDLVLLDYFAIDERSRGKGYGSKSLFYLKSRYKDKRLFLEIEQPMEGTSNNEERIRRKAFYLRNGFTEMGIMVNLFGVSMELLCYGCEVTFDEYQNLYRHIVGDFIARNVVKQIPK